MGLESATYIDGLNTSNPVGASDFVSQGDDHLRLIKTAIKATFPGVAFPIGYNTFGGSATALTLTLAVAPAAYVDGMRVWGRIPTGGTATGAATLNVNALGAVSVVKNHDQPIEAGDWEEDQIVEFMYNSADTTFELVTPIAHVAVTDGDIGVTVQAYNAGISSTPLEEGKHTIWIPAGSWTPLTTNGCDLINQVEDTPDRPEMLVLDFDKDDDEYAQFSIAMPKSWDKGTISYLPVWTCSAGTTGDVIWEMAAVALADSDPVDTAYGSGVQVSDAFDAQGDIHYAGESGAITVDGSPGNDELTYLRIGRLGSDGSDTFDADARLIGVLVFYTVNAGNDA